MKRKMILGIPMAFGIFLTILLSIFFSNQAEAVIEDTDNVSITIWHSELDDSVLTQIASNFQTQYPTITVQVQHKDFNILFDDFVQAASAGGGPELLRGPNDWIGPLASQGLILATDLDFNYTLFITEAVSGTLWNEMHWAVPDTHGNHLMLFFNKNLLPSGPINTTEFISTALNLTGGGQYGLVYNLNDPFWLIPWLTGYGGWVLKNVNGHLTPTLNTPAMVNALGFIQDFRWEHGIVPTGTIDYGTADSYFLNGKAAMMINGDWTLEIYRDHFGDNNLGVSRIPFVLDTNLWPQPMIGGKVYMLNANSSNEALAATKLFLQYATSAQSQLLWSQNLSVLPALLDALNDPIIQGDPILQASLDQASLGRLMPADEEMGCVWEAMKPVIPQVVDNNLDTGIAAATMQANAAKCVWLLQADKTYLPVIIR